MEQKIIPVPAPEVALVSEKEMHSILDGTTGRSTSALDNLSIYNQGKEDYWTFDDDKKRPEVLGIFLFSVRPARAFWHPDKQQDGSPPECWSFDGIKPSPDVREPKNATCQGCKWDQLKTAKQGKGRACKTKSNDFILEVSGHDLMPDGKTILLDPGANIIGPALLRYSIANKEAPKNWATFVKAAKALGRPPQGVLLRWKWQAARSSTNVKFSAVDYEVVGPLCAPAQDTELWNKILAEVQALKNGLAVQILTMLSGSRDDE